jgi:hypothetical protein
MYSNPGPREDYIYVTGGDGRPISLPFHTGLTASKANKKFNSHLKSLCADLKVPPSRAPREVRVEAAQQTLEDLRKLSQKRRRPLPEPARWVYVVIRREGNGFSETPDELVGP